MVGVNLTFASLGKPFSDCATFLSFFSRYPGTCQTRSTSWRSDFFPPMCGHFPISFAAALAVHFVEIMGFKWLFMLSSSLDMQLIKTRVKNTQTHTWHKYTTQTPSHAPPCLHPRLCLYPSEFICLNPPLSFFPCFWLKISIHESQQWCPLLRMRPLAKVTPEGREDSRR